MLYCVFFLGPLCYVHMLPQVAQLAELEVPMPILYIGFLAFFIGIAVFFVRALLNL